MKDIGDDMRSIYMLPYPHDAPEDIKEILSKKIKWEKLPSLDVFYLEQTGLPVEIDMKALPPSKRENVVLHFLVAAYYMLLTSRDIALLTIRVREKEKFRIVPVENSYTSKLLRKICEHVSFRPFIRARDYIMAKYISSDLKEGENGFIMYGFSHDLRGYLKSVDQKIFIESILEPKELQQFLSLYV